MSKNIDYLASENFQLAMNSCSGNLNSVMKEIEASLREFGYDPKEIYGGYGLSVNIMQAGDEDYSHICKLLEDSLERHGIQRNCLHLVFDITVGNTCIGIVQRRI